LRKWESVRWRTGGDTEQVSDRYFKRGLAVGGRSVFRSGLDGRCLLHRFNTTRDPTRFGFVAHCELERETVEHRVRLRHRLDPRRTAESLKVSD
jgi:hypothetical protein